MYFKNVKIKKDKFLTTIVNNLIIIVKGFKYIKIKLKYSYFSNI